MTPTSPTRTPTTCDRIFGVDEDDGFDQPIRIGTPRTDRYGLGVPAIGGSQNAAEEKSEIGQESNP